MRMVRLCLAALTFLLFAANIVAATGVRGVDGGECWKESFAIEVLFAVDGAADKRDDQRAQASHATPCHDHPSTSVDANCPNQRMMTGVPAYGSEPALAAEPGRIFVPPPQ
jgi:hypothetical protein